MYFRAGAGGVSLLGINIRKIAYELYVLLMCALCSGCGMEQVTVSKVPDDTSLSVDISETYTGMDTEEKEDAVVTVYVCGAVVHEGVYELDSNSRVNDALVAAGGFAEDADTDNINLAAKVQDGEKVYFPRLGEVTDYSLGNDSDGQSVININTAGTSELTSLPGIGETRAERIVAYRQSHGSFANIEELKNVSGIGDNIYEGLEEYITVD